MGNLSYKLFDDSPHVAWPRSAIACPRCWRFPDKTSLPPAIPDTAFRGSSIVPGQPVVCCTAPLRAIAVRRQELSPEYGPKLPDPPPPAAAFFFGGPRPNCVPHGRPKLGCSLTPGPDGDR